MDAEATRAEDAPSGPTDAFHLNCPNCDAAIDLIPSTRLAEPDLRAVLEEAGSVLDRLLDYALVHDCGLLENAVESRQSPLVTDAKRALTRIDAALHASASQENG